MLNFTSTVLVVAERLLCSSGCSMICLAHTGAARSSFQSRVRPKALLSAVATMAALFKRCSTIYVSRTLELPKQTSETGHLRSFSGECIIVLLELIGECPMRHLASAGVLRAGAPQPACFVLSQFISLSDLSRLRLYSFRSL
eukprot:scaffold38569_cov20-Tisochrysis_lutea.AAC.1